MNLVFGDYYSCHFRPPGDSIYTDRPLTKHSRVQFHFRTSASFFKKEGGVRICVDAVGFARFLVRFCGHVYFKLRYCGFKKTNRFAVFRNFRVISMLFAVFFCYSVRCLYVFLWAFVVFLPSYAPLKKHA